MGKLHSILQPAVVTTRL